MSAGRCLTAFRGETIVRQKGASRIDEVDARQAVVVRDLLRSDVLPDGHRQIGAAFDGRVVCDDQHLAPGNAADPRYEPGTGRLVVVQIPRGERRQLEER